MKPMWAHIWIGIVVFGVAACSAVKREPTSWSAAALRTADALAAKLRAADIKCEDYRAASIAAYDEQYKGRLPLAAAVASCTTHGDEDLTFEVFEDSAHAQEFVRAKQTLLCHVATANQIEGFPGFAYVDGGAWVIEPDEKETGDEIAPILGGQSKIADCPAQPPPGAAPAPQAQ